MPFHLVAAVRTACLLTALEPGSPRRRIESALVLLGLRASSVDEAVAQGVLRVDRGRVDLVDARVGRVVVESAVERERRTAHLALACARDDGRAAARPCFDALCTTLNPPPPSPPESTGPAAPGHLTPRERHVAELAATGARTCEIAAAAYLSQKTVEYHLTRVYRKLGVRSKAELAVVFRAGDLVTTGH